MFSIKQDYTALFFIINCERGNVLLRNWYVILFLSVINQT